MAAIYSEIFIRGEHVAFVYDLRQAHTQASVKLIGWSAYFLTGMVSPAGIEIWKEGTLIGADKREGEGERESDDVEVVPTGPVLKRAVAAWCLVGALGMERTFGVWAWLARGVPGRCPWDWYEAGPLALSEWRRRIADFSHSDADGVGRSK